MKNKILLFLCCVLLLLTACKTTRNVQRQAQKMPVAQLIENIRKQQPRFATANVSKMTMEFDMNDRKVSVSASCKIRTDSAIYLSVQPLLGIELFKAELTADSIRVFDKMNNRYFVVDYTYFRKRFGVDVDFYNLQSMIFGQFFCIGQGNRIPVDSCKLTMTPQGLYQIDYATKKMTQSTLVSPEYQISEVNLKSNDSDYQLQTSYSDYIRQNEINYPQKITLHANGQKSRANADFSILRVEFNTALKFQPTNAARFNRADIDQILKK